MVLARERKCPPVGQTSVLEVGRKTVERHTPFDKKSLASKQTRNDVDVSAEVGFIYSVMGRIMRCQFNENGSRMIDAGTKENIQDSWVLNQRGATIHLVTIAGEHCLQDLPVLASWHAIADRHSCQVCPAVAHSLIDLLTIGRRSVDGCLLLLVTERGQVRLLELPESWQQHLFFCFGFVLFCFSFFQSQTINTVRRTEKDHEAPNGELPRLQRRGLIEKPMISNRGENMQQTRQTCRIQLRLQVFGRSASYKYLRLDLGKLIPTVKP
jgi:hypothetical protein